MEKEKPPQIYLKTKKPLVVEGNTYISVYDFQLTKYDLEKAHRELKETEDCKTSCLKELKKKLEGDQTKQFRTDDDFLLRYLRYCKFNYDKAYKLIRNFYSLRKKHPEIFTIPPDLETLLSYNFVTYIPYTDEQGRIVFWVDFRKWNPDEISLVEMLQAVHLIMDFISANPKIQINGLVGIWDFRGVNMKHVVPVIYPKMAWFLSKFFQDAYPFRINYVIGIYSHILIRTAFNIIRPILKQKTLDRVRLLGSDMTELHKYINPAVLPKEYGGTIEERECTVTQEILQNLPYLQYENSFM